MKASIMYLTFYYAFIEAVGIIDAKPTSALLCGRPNTLDTASDFTE